MVERIAIIGGAGYIGCHVAKEFSRNKWDVSIFDNLSTGLRTNLLSDWDFYHGDVENSQDLRNFFSTRTVSAVVHLAAKKSVGESMQSPEIYARINLGGTITLLEEMHHAGISRLVFSSSAAVYGAPQYTPLDEQHPTVPENFYGYTKKAMEEILQWYAKLKGIQSVSLRYFNAAGNDPDAELHAIEMQPTNLLPIIMKVALGQQEQLEIFGNDYPTPDGTGIRDYIHVTDLARAHVQALRYLQDNQASTVFNLGTGKGISVLEMLDRARKITDRAIPSIIVPRRPGDPPVLFASTEKAHKLLKWTARYTEIDEIIRTAWKIWNS